MLPLLAMLTACPHTKTAPETAVEIVVAQPEPDVAPEPAPESAAIVPVDGPSFESSFAFEDGQSARLTQTLIEQSSLPGMMASRVTIESRQHFQVLADGDNFAVHQDVDDITVDMEGPEDLIGPMESALARAMHISPTIVIDASGTVQDVIIPEDQIAAAHTDIAAIAADAEPQIQPAIEQAAEALLDPDNLATAGERGVAPWNVGERLLPFEASETVDDREYIFVGWVPCAEADTEPSCGALLVQIDAGAQDLEDFGAMLTEQFAEVPEDQRPAVMDVTIDEQYLFVLEPENGRVRRSAHDKRTTAMLDIGGQMLPYVKNLSTAEIWTWDAQ